MNTYTVWSYDVWGEEGGFEVNDRTKQVEDLELPDTLTDKEIVRALKDAGLIKPGVGVAKLDIGGDDMSITVDDARNGRPLYGLEKN